MSYLFAVASLEKLNHYCCTYFIRRFFASNHNNLERQADSLLSTSCYFVLLIAPGFFYDLVPLCDPELSTLKLSLQY